MKCPDCDFYQLNNINEYRDKNNVRHRHVICEPDRGGCGHSFWYQPNGKGTTILIDNKTYEDYSEFSKTSETMKQVKHPFTQIFPPKNVMKMQEIDTDGIR